MEKNLTSIKKVAELRYESLKEEFIYLHNTLKCVDYTMDNIDENNTTLKKVIDNVTASIADHICGEFQAFESISEEWLDGFFNFLLENPTYDGYLYPNSLIEVILMYKEHRDDYKAEIEAFMSK